MIVINPYLNFMGNTEAAMNFYRSVFGGEFSIYQKYKDVPGGDKMHVEDQEKIMHISLPIGKAITLMGTDALESMGEPLNVGNNISLSISAETEKEADKLFNALAEGGQIKLAMNKAFWGAYFGMLTDQFGIQWMITCGTEQSK